MMNFVGLHNESSNHESANDTRTSIDISLNNIDMISDVTSHSHIDKIQ
jgi:hypothetical protein